MKRNFGGQPSLGAMPRSYQVTPKVLGRRRATQALPVSKAHDAEVESQPAASPRTNRNGRTTPPKPGKTMTVTEVCAGATRARLAFWIGLRPAATARRTSRAGGASWYLSSGPVSKRPSVSEAKAPADDGDVVSELCNRPNSAVRLPLTAPPARRSHCRRAIVPTAASRRCLCHDWDREPTSLTAPMATRESPARRLADERSAVNAIPVLNLVARRGRRFA